MRAIVCGGRTIRDKAMVFRALDEIAKTRQIDLVIHGGCRGTDKLAAAWARSRLIPTVTFQARWEEEGRAAGPLRNRRMIELGRPDLVIAFPGGDGTASMVRLARQQGIPVLQPLPPAERSAPRSPPL